MERTKSTLNRRGFLGSMAVTVGAAVGLGRSVRAESSSRVSEPATSSQNPSPSKRTFKAIDWSINAWFPGGIGARFSGIGHPELGVCNNSSPWAGLPYSKNRREEVIRGWTPEFIIERFDLAGVEKGGLLACWAAEGLGGKECRVEADEVYAVVNKYPDRFYGIVGVCALPGRWSKYYAPTYIKYAVQQLGFKGVHMYPHWFGVKINDTRMYPIYETCSELDVPFLFQIGTGTGMSNSRMCALPEWIDDVARDFPTLKIVGIHGGGSWEQNFISMLGKDPNVYWGLDASPPSTWTQPQRGIVDLLKQDRGPGYREQRQNYQDKVMWGTDFPVQDWAVSLEQFDALGLPEEIARKVLRENVSRLFKL
ncbi:MAG: amidohydrolase [Acidobacteria bacterium]|nr:amidohydrolase [Acidobacteriota bacterium]